MKSMKWMLLSLLAAAVAVTSSHAQTAKPAEPSSFMILTRMVCSESLPELIAYLGKRFGEKPLAEFGTTISMQSIVPGVPPALIPGPGVLLVNPETGTYSLLMQLRDTEGVCMISTGLNFRPWGTDPTKSEKPEKKM